MLSCIGDPAVPPKPPAPRVRHAWTSRVVGEQESIAGRIVTIRTPTTTTKQNGQGRRCRPEHTHRARLSVQKLKQVGICLFLPSGSAYCRSTQRTQPRHIFVFSFVCPETCTSTQALRYFYKYWEQTGSLDRERARCYGPECVTFCPRACAGVPWPDKRQLLQYMINKTTTTSTSSDGNNTRSLPVGRQFLVSSLVVLRINRQELTRGREKQL